jgi:hypothetical protein
LRGSIQLFSEGVIHETVFIDYFTHFGHCDHWLFSQDGITTITQASRGAF